MENNVTDFPIFGITNLATDVTNLSSDVMILSLKVKNTKVANFLNIFIAPLIFPIFSKTLPPKKNLSSKVKDYRTNLSSYVTNLSTEVTNLSKQVKSFFS